MIDLGPKVYNRHHKNVPTSAVYIGRGSPYGNPYTHLDSSHKNTIKVESREEAIKEFKEKVLPNLDLRPLIGKSVVCFCAPAPCHGDVLIEAAKQLQKELI